MYFICRVTPQDHSVEMSCMYMGESSLQHVTTMKSLVIMGTLMVKKKNALSKTQNMYYHWKIELIGLPLGKKKMSQPEKYTFWEELTKN